jgi:hypothetical protein
MHVGTFMGFHWFFARELDNRCDNIWTGGGIIGTLEMQPVAGVGHDISLILPILITGLGPSLSNSMANCLSRFATRVAYGASQLPRVAWYAGHGEIMRRLSKAARQRVGESTRTRPSTSAPVPDRQRLYVDMAALFLQDLANVEAGIYPLPVDHDGSLPMMIDRSRKFFEDLPEIHRRREGGRSRQVLNQDTRGKRPRYYLQNFHFQSGGWMTKESAERYDTQVEVLLNGTANATRRQALRPIREVIAGRDQRRLRFLDVGCGTGRFLESF